jgi:hypothetical protein
LDLESNIRAISDGLVGELYGDNGWIARFSKFKEDSGVAKLT